MHSPPRYRAAIEAVSLVLGPALMSIGDLLHPAETWDMTAQVAIVAQSAGRWFAAHLLLFLGLLIFVPGILAVARLVAVRRPAAGYAAGVLLLASVGALSAVFGFEMLLGLFQSQVADQMIAVTLLETFQSRLFFVLVPGLLAFFIGTALAVVSLASPGSPFRGPALALGLGAFLILGEIILAQVLLSQIGNILMLVAGIGFARRLRSPEQSPVPIL